MKVARTGSKEPALSSWKKAEDAHVGMPDRLFRLSVQLKKDPSVSVVRLLSARFHVAVPSPLGRLCFDRHGEVSLPRSTGNRKKIPTSCAELFSSISRLLGLCRSRVKEDGSVSSWGSRRIQARAGRGGLDCRSPEKAARNVACARRRQRLVCHRESSVKREEIQGRRATKGQLEMREKARRRREKAKKPPASKERRQKSWGPRGQRRRP